MADVDLVVKYESSVCTYDVAGGRRYLGDSPSFAALLVRRQRLGKLVQSLLLPGT